MYKLYSSCKNFKTNRSQIAYCAYNFNSPFVPDKYVISRSEHFGSF